MVRIFLLFVTLAHFLFWADNKEEQANTTSMPNGNWDQLNGVIGP